MQEKRGSNTCGTSTASALREGGERISAKTSEPWAEEREGQALVGALSMSGEEAAEPGGSGTQTLVSAVTNIWGITRALQKFEK